VFSGEKNQSEIQESYFVMHQKKEKRISSQICCSLLGEDWGKQQHTSWIEVGKSKKPTKFFVKRWESYFVKLSFQLLSRSFISSIKNDAFEKQKSLMPSDKFLQNMRHVNLLKISWYTYTIIYIIIISVKIVKYFDRNFCTILSCVLFKNMKFAYKEFISNTKTPSSCWVTEK